MLTSCPKPIALSAGLWEQSDAVKALHSRLLLSDVLAERAKQVSCAQQKLAQIQDEEKIYTAQQRADLEVLLCFASQSLRFRMLLHCCRDELRLVTKIMCCLAQLYGRCE